MSTVSEEPIQANATLVDEEQQLTAIVQQNALLPETAQNLKTSFAPLFQEAHKVIEQSRAVVVTDASQKLQMKVAREYRIALKGIRVLGEKKHKELKEESLRRGKAIDGFKNILLDVIATEESRLEQQEKFVELQEQKRKEELKATRAQVLREIQVDPALYNLGEMNDDTFSQLVEGTKLARAAAAETARKAEAERIDREAKEAAERERVRLENERLKKEAEEKEAALKAEREERARQEKEAADERAKKERLHAEQLERERAAAAEKAKAEREAMEKKHAEERRIADEKAAEERKKAEAAQKAAAEKARKEKEIADAKAKEERAAREKAEAELRAQREAEDKRRAEQKRKEEEAEAERRKAAAAPDKDRLLNYANAIRAIDVPDLKTNPALTTLIETQRSKFIAWLETSVEKL